MEGVRVRWKSGRADPASGETHAQALIPLSHTGREQQAPPSALPGDFPEQAAAQRRPRQCTSAPALNPAPGAVVPAAVIERETSNRWLAH